MFLKEMYIVTILCLVQCEIGQCTGQTTKDLRKLEDKRSVDSKGNKLTMKNDKMSARQNLIKQKEKKYEKTSKWPKFQRKGRAKDTLRITKLDMLQDNEEMTEKVESLEAQEDNLSSYSIKQQLLKLAQNMPQSNITVEVIGRTVEYQDIVMLRITELKDGARYFRADDRYAEEVPEKKIIFIVHGLSVMGMGFVSCFYMFDYFKILLSYYTSHLDKFDIFLIPMANPDGIAYLDFNKERVWNKNVSPQSECPGVALDRNFDVAWGSKRSISSCSQDYPGKTPFSEAETRAVRDIFHKYAHKIIAYFHVHAGPYDTTIFRGDAVLYPKGYSDTALDDDKYIDLKGEIDEAIRNASFQVLSVAVDTLYNWYGKVSGTSVDYASTVYGIPFAMELVMQYYEDHSGYTEPESDKEPNTSLALVEVWKRVINVIFNYIYKSLNNAR